MIKIFHLQIRSGQHLYFGSKKAIFLYAENNNVNLGITYNSFRNIRDLPYQNKYCIIRVGELIQAPTNRGKKLLKIKHQEHNLLNEK